VDVSAGAGGFSIASGEDPPLYVLKLMGLIQADCRVYVGDRTKDNILLRRVRPILAGTVLGLVDFYLMPDFGGGQTVLMDAYLDAHPFPWLRLRVGKFKPPVGLERLQSDPDMPIAERALTSNLSSTRDVGAQLWGEVANGTLVYMLAVLDGAPDSGQFDLDVGGKKDFAARAFVLPFKSQPDLGALGLGIAATTGVTRSVPDKPTLVAQRTEGQTTLFSYFQPSTDSTGTGNVYAAGPHSRLNPELFYYSGPFGLLAEAIWSRQALALGSASATLTHVAWHITASWVLGGENGFTGATPKHAFDWSQHHFGALEIGARISRIVYSDTAFLVFASAAASAQTAEGLSLAANWVLSRNARLAVDLLHTGFNGGGGKAGAIADRKPENLLLVRTQVNF
jgi:phosphate-selective porin OprO/OprP